MDLDINSAAVQYRTRRTLCELLHDRGYALVPFQHFRTLRDVYDQQLDIFTQQFGQQPLTWSLMATRGQEKVVTLCQVSFTAANEPLLVDISKTGVTTVIVIYSSQPKSNQMRKIAEIELATKVAFEVFTYEELQFNLTKNFLVPRHVVLTNQQKKEVLDSYKIQESDLPIILKNDAVARYLGIQAGQVVMIQKETQGKYHKWTQLEIEALMDAVKIYGMQWEKIKNQIFPTLSASQVKNKYYVRLYQDEQKESKPKCNKNYLNQLMCEQLIELMRPMQM